jgi:hypothetical protein
MEEPTRNTPDEEPTSEETLGRRQLLKALAATTGAIAASSMLPGEWAKPVVEAGVLPAHAQVTPTSPPTSTPVPLRYSIVCDSQPGGGDLNATEGLISNIQPYILVTSGTGPVDNIPATMSVEVTSGPAPSFDPSLPQNTTTGPAGRANFGSLQVFGQPGTSFFLVFDFTTPSGNVRARCGEFFFGL